MPGRARLIDLELSSGATGPRRARGVVAEALAHLGRLDDLLLCVSEVVTNAVVHAVAPVHLVVETTRLSVRVEVSDGSSSRPIRRSVDPSSPTGRGLFLLDRLASRWGVDVHEPGKTVWFEFEAMA